MLGFLILAPTPVLTQSNFSHFRGASPDLALSRAKDSGPLALSLVRNPNFAERPLAKCEQLLGKVGEGS